MSRTYRKAKRHFFKFDGEFYNSYKDKTIQGKASHYLKSDDWDWDWKTGCFAGYFLQMVSVADGENYRRIPHGVKPMHHRMDRARFKQALINNEDAFIVPSFDPLDL